MKHKRVSDSLDSFELFYEEMETKVPKQVKKNLPTARDTRTTGKPQVKVDKSLSKPKVSFKTRVENVKTAVRGKFNNVQKKLGIQRKKAKKTTKTERQLARKQKIRGIIGIGLLFVVVSITYSTYMTALFVDGPVMVATLAPQVIFAVITLLIAFYKIYK